MQFLYDCRRNFGAVSKIDNLPLKLLNEYFRLGGSKDTIFKVSGFQAYSNTGITYTIDTNKCTIKLSSTDVYGASYNGITDVAHAIMNSGISYKNLSLKDAITLTRNCILENIDVFKYHSEQLIGGECQTYVLDKLHGKIGWYRPNGTMEPDEDAPADTKWEEKI
jgi:hypothetical protein